MFSSTNLMIVVACSFSLVGCAEDSVAVDESDTGAADSSVDTGVVAMDTGVATDTTPPGDSPPPLDTGGTAASPDCDLNGRWLLSQRILASAIGQKQASHNWFYYEIKQDGENVTVTKALHCGYVVKKVSALAVDVSSEPAWPSILAKCSLPGRTGHFKLVGDSCQFDLAKEYVVRGATVSKYRDPSVPLPKIAEQAMGATPGWEDWEPDTKPGITLSVSGAASGKLYVVQRDWTEFVAPKVAKKADKWSSPVTWDSEQSVLGRDGPSLLEQDSNPDSDASQHFVWFHRLTGSQATGTDAEICAAVRTLKDTLVPEANK